MGLNMGITVKKLKYTGEWDGGHNPPVEGLQDQFWEFLKQKFPEEGAFGVHIDATDEKYDFDIRFTRYGSLFQHSMQDMHQAIFEFILNHFGFTQEDLQLSVYYSP